MNRNYCVVFSVNMIHLLSFSSQWKMKKKIIWGVEGREFEAWKWVWKLLLFSRYPANRFCSLAHLNLIKNQQNKGQNCCIHQRTPHLKPPWSCSVGACSWCHRNLQNMKRIGEICSESHTWEQLKEVGCSYFLSFICIRSFTTVKTSLMKRYCVSNSELGAGRQNCSLVPNSWVGHRAQWVKDTSLGGNPFQRLCL